MSEYFDTLETREPAARESQLMQALPQLLEHARQNAPAFREILAGVDAAGVASRQALAKLPVTRKHELLERQKAQRATDPFGGFSAQLRGPQMPRLFASPGPIYEPEGVGKDYDLAVRNIDADVQVRTAAIDADLLILGNGTLRVSTSPPWSRGRQPHCVFSTSALLSRLPWLSIAPLLRPVVPLV